MTDQICVGAMLLADGTDMPEPVIAGTQPYAAGWSSILRSSGAQLGREIEKAGWTFFYMAGGIRASGFGFNQQSRTNRAVARVIAAVERENCNCLEIGEVRQRSFLGLPYTSVAAHARHIQQSRSFPKSSS